MRAIHQPRGRVRAGGAAQQQRKRRSARRLGRSVPVALLAALLALAGCEGGAGTLAPVREGARLLPGVYRYRAWSDHGGADPAWWGYLELEVDRGGELYGTYRLPWQCSDEWGYEADCVGRVGGRVYRDGLVRFGLDEGWLAHEGVLRRGSRVTGSWETRLLGYRDAGGFELEPYPGP